MNENSKQNKTEFTLDKGKAGERASIESVNLKPDQPIPNEPQMKGSGQH